MGGIEKISVVAAYENTLPLKVFNLKGSEMKKSIKLIRNLTEQDVRTINLFIDRKAVSVTRTGKVTHQ